MHPQGGWRQKAPNCRQKVISYNSRTEFGPQIQHTTVATEVYRITFWHDSRAMTPNCAKMVPHNTEMEEFSGPPCQPAGSRAGIYLRSAGLLAWILFESLILLSSTFRDCLKTWCVDSAGLDFSKKLIVVIMQAERTWCFYTADWNLFAHLVFLIL